MTNEQKDEAIKLACIAVVSYIIGKHMMKRSFIRGFRSARFDLDFEKSDELHRWLNDANDRRELKQVMKDWIEKRVVPHI